MYIEAHPRRSATHQFTPHFSGPRFPRQSSPQRPPLAVFPFNEFRPVEPFSSATACNKPSAIKSFRTLHSRCCSTGASNSFEIKRFRTLSRHNGGIHASLYFPRLPFLQSPSFLTLPTRSLRSFAKECLGNPLQPTRSALFLKTAGCMANPNQIFELKLLEDSRLPAVAGPPNPTLGPSLCSGWKKEMGQTRKSAPQIPEGFAPVPFQLFVTKFPQTCLPQAGCLQRVGRHQSFRSLFPLVGTVLSGGWLVGEDVGGDFAEVPHDPEPGEHLQRVVGEVHFPPVEALACRGHEVMMIVVPAFAERHDGEQPVVFAGVGCFIAPRTEQVRERIDGKRVVPQHDRAQAEAPHEKRPPADENHSGSQSNRRHQMILVQPAQLRIFCEIADVIEPRVIIFIRNNPPDVRPEKPEKCRRMQVQVLVGIAVMMPVMRRPPEHALLRGRRGHERNHKLENAAGLEGAVRKIAVVPGGHKKHAHQENAQACKQIGPVKWNKEDRQHEGMNQEKRQRMNERNARTIR